MRAGGQARFGFGGFGGFLGGAAFDIGFGFGGVGRIGGFFGLDRSFDLFGGNFGLFVFEHLIHYIDAVFLQFGFIVAARDIHRYFHRHFGMQHDFHVIYAQRLDRPFEHDHTLVNMRTFGIQAIGNVAHGYRTIKLPGVGCRADQDDLFAFDMRGCCCGIIAARRIVAFDSGAVGLKHFLICRVGAQRFFVGQQEVAGIAVLHRHHIAN